jgi:hypothetical protein
MIGRAGWRGIAHICDMHRGECEPDAVRIKRPLYEGVGPSDRELLARPGHHLQLDLDREFAKLRYDLHLEGLKDVYAFPRYERSSFEPIPGLGSLGPTPG